MDDLCTRTIVEPSSETEISTQPAIKEECDEIFQSSQIETPTDFEEAKIDDKPGDLMPVLPDENVAISTCNIKVEWIEPEIPEESIEVDQSTAPIKEISAKTSDLTTLSWAGYNRQLTNGLWSCFQDNFETDFELCPNNSSAVKVHHLVLSVFCPQLRGATEKRLSLDIDDDGLNVIVEFLYNGKMRVREDQLEDVKNAAHTLGFDVLVDIIENFVGVERGKQNENDSAALQEDIATQQMTEPDGRHHVMKDNLEVGEGASGPKSSTTDHRQQKIQNLFPQEPEKSVMDKGSDVKGTQSANILVCPSCPFTCNSLLGLSDHVARCNVTSQASCPSKLSNRQHPLFRCPLCSTTHAQKPLEEHLKTGHRMSHAQVHRIMRNIQRYRVKGPLADANRSKKKKKTSVLRCNKCSFSCRTSTELIKHRAECKVKCVTFRCEHCPYVNRYKSNLSRHQLTHRSIKTVECSQCGRAFAPASIKRHKLLMHSTNSENKKKLLLEMSAAEFQNFTKKINDSSTQQHLLTKPCSVRVDPMTVNDPSVTLTCPSCSYVTDNFIQLQKHLDCHVVKLFKCEKCTFQCRYLVDLGDHLRRCHSGASDVTLSSHSTENQVQNTSEKPFKCDWCSCAFKTMGNLKAHILLVH